MEGLFLIVLLLGLALVYFLPAMIASSRAHRQANAIGALNLVLGWTVLGWVAALVWAVTDHAEVAAQATGGPAVPTVECPGCRMRIDFRASICPHCRSSREVDAKEIERWESPAAQAPAKAERQADIAVISVCVLLGSTIVVLLYFAWARS